MFLEVVRELAALGEILRRLQFRLSPAKGRSNATNWQLFSVAKFRHLESSTHTATTARAACLK